MLYFAFDYGGCCTALGDCENWQAAEEIALDKDPTGFVFLMTEEEIIDLAKGIKKYRRQYGTM